MCLETNKKRTKLSKEKIECYKLLYVNCDNTVYTPYFATVINETVLNGKKPFRAKGFIDKWKEKCYRSQKDDNTDIRYNYGKGLIHTFKSLDVIRQRIGRHGIVICKCHVPKYTRYVDNETEIASKKIIFDEIIWDGRIKYNNY